MKSLGYLIGRLLPRRGRRLLSAFLAVPAISMAQGASPPTVQMVLDLSDGSRIVGVPAIDDLRIKTDYADLDIPLSQVRTVALTGTGNAVAKANLRNGDSLTGHMAATELNLKTMFGPVSIPVSGVRKIEINDAVAGRGALPPGLVLDYSFATESGDRVLDVSGNGNDGTVRGGAYTHDEKGNGAMSFDGKGEGVMIGNAPALHLQDFTILCWMKRGDLAHPGADAEDGMLIGFGTNGFGFGLHTDNALYLTKTYRDAVYSSFTITDQAFHQVGVTKDGPKVIFYLDGKAFPANDYDPGFEFTTDVAVAVCPTNLSCSFLGTIRGVEVFDHPLSADEINQIYDLER